MRIIHHNERIDFEKLIKQSYSNYIGLDANDFQNFTKDGSEIHSFVSIENGENRIKRGLEKILKDDEMQSIIDATKSFMIIFCHSVESNSPIYVYEIQESNEILDRYFSDKDILWGLAESNELKDFVKVIVLAKL